jgi:hypothetical protein
MGWGLDAGEATGGGVRGVENWQQGGTPTRWWWWRWDGNTMRFGLVASQRKERSAYEYVNDVVSVSTSLNLGVKPARMTLSDEAMHSMMSPDR